MSASNRFVRLDPEEITPERPFTNPDRNARDLAILRYVREQLCRVISRPDKLPSGPGPLVLHFLEGEARRHRIVITRMEVLLSDRELTWVGFCGRQRPNTDSSVLEDIDVELIDEFSDHPHLLSYSSLELDNGDWRNLVLFRDPEGIRHWRSSARHAYAARQLSPQCYTSVRLHSGVLRGGLMSDNDLIILRTKYYDFRGEGTWRAIRELAQP